MSKYKYYLQKPKSELAKDLLKAVAVTGALVILMSSPYVASNIWRSRRRWQNYPQKKFRDTFTNLRRRGYLILEENEYDLNICLTDKGKAAVGWMQIDELKIAKSKKWDRKWRVVMFDIAELNRAHRNAFRAKLKELGLRYLQKSVWVCPWECSDEINLLKSFFGLDQDSIFMLTATKIDRAAELQKLFSL